MKTIRRRWSSMRLTRSKTRKVKQEEALLNRAMNPPSNEAPATASATEEPQSSKEVLSVFINDFTDPDNQAAALLWAECLKQHNVKGIYIAEPRHVLLGHYITGLEFADLMKLLMRLAPHLGTLSGVVPLTIMLAGQMTDEIIEDVIGKLKKEGTSLSKREIVLLEKCIKPIEVDASPEGDHDTKSNNANLQGTKRTRTVEQQDAIRHAHLLVMDFLSTMRRGDELHFDAYVDCKCLDTLLSPINLKLHSHEELVFRTASELQDFRTITESGQDISQKSVKLREWYEEAITRKKESDFDNTQPWTDLEDSNDYDKLFDEMNEYERVNIFGGCSLTILNHLLQQERRDGLSGKIAYYQQGGTFDSGINILGNPLNFALNYDAAYSVFDKASKLAKFRLIPTDTTKMFEFTVKGLTQWSHPVGLHCLGFYGKVEIWDLIAPEEAGNLSASTQDIIEWRSKLVLDAEKYEDPSFRGYKAVIADLVAFLISFTDAFKEYPSPRGVLHTCKVGVVPSKRPLTGNGQMVLEEGDASSVVEALMLKGDVEAGVKLLVGDVEKLIKDALKSGSSRFKSGSTDWI